jgi:hypothetical protein
MTNLKNLEADSLIFKKLLDGINLPTSHDKVILDASFSDMIVPEYLLDKFGYKKIFTIVEKMQKGKDTIIPIPLTTNVANAMAGQKVDIFLSLGSSTKLFPVFDVVHALHRCLIVGGRFIITVYPDIYDEQGRDILNGLSLISEIPVKEKLTRYYVTFKNALSNIFMRVSEDEILSKIEVKHLISFFGTDLYTPYLFNSFEDHDRFFKPIAHLDIEYNISWKVLMGYRI